MESEFSAARRNAAALSRRMSKRAGILSEAEYFGHRLDRAAHRETDQAREDQRIDAAELASFVAWALERHRASMLSWAEAAGRMELSTAYRTGWQQTAERWRAPDEEPDGPAPPALSWLITMWHRACKQRNSRAGQGEGR